MTTHKNLQLVTIAGLLFLLIAGSGIASATSVSAHADERQLEMIKEMYGTKMTYGEFWGKVFPDQLAEMKKNFPEEQYTEFSNTVVYWGDDHPELPSGATVWDENGPVNLREISSEEKQKFGLEDLKTDESGYVVRGGDTAVLDKLAAMISRRTAAAPMSGLVLNANDLWKSGSSIGRDGTGLVAGAPSATLMLRTELYGDGGMVDYYQINFPSYSGYISDIYPYPINGVYYQQKLIGQSSNPSLYGYVWSYGRLWPF
jgi:hypothetical protein